MDRLTVPAGARWARTLAYSRAVRVGPYVAVSQTSAANEAGDVVGGGDAYSQALQALGNVERALERAGASLNDVIRTRIYVAKFDDWTEVARAHAEIFGDIRPAVSLLTCTMVSPEILVEFEADAVVMGGAVVRRHRIEQLAAQRAAAQKPYLEFLRSSALSVGLYVLAAGEQDLQQPHTEDEVYYVISGARAIQGWARGACR